MFAVMVGFFLKLVYDIKAGYTAPTPQAGEWKEITKNAPNTGTIGVIQYYFTYLGFPKVSLKDYPVFSRPPLFFWTASWVMQIIHRMMKWAAGTCLHVVQCINVIYTVVGIGCGIGMAFKAGIRGRRLTMAILFLTFFPASYTIGAELNEQAMAFMFSMLTLREAMSWYETRREKNLLKMGLFLGLGLMTSFVCIVTVPAIFTLYYYGVRDGRRNVTSPKKQIVHFLLITLPIGLWWPIFRMVYYHVPFTFCEAAYDGSEKFRGFNLLKRAGIATPDEIARIDFQHLQLWKTGGWAIARFSVYLMILIAILMLVMWFRSSDYEDVDHPMKRFLFNGFVGYILFYLLLNLFFPYDTMMDIKMFAPVVIFPVIGSSFCGNGSHLDHKFEQITTWIEDGAILLYAILSAVLFGFYF